MAKLRHGVMWPISQRIVTAPGCLLTGIYLDTFGIRSESLIGWLTQTLIVITTTIIIIIIIIANIIIIIEIIFIIV